MKKKLLVIAALLLVCVLFAGMASAEYGYTRVSDIPMAVDFTYSVEFAEDGTPYVQTDYPFEETGAMQMILIYCKEDRPTTLQILYDPVTKQSNFGTFPEDLFPGLDKEQAFREAARIIRDGEITLHCILIETLHGAPDTDWWMEYSVRRQQYASYKENNFSPSYNETDPNAKYSIIGINYTDGMVSLSYIWKTSPMPNHTHLCLYYNAYGKLIPSYSYIQKTSPEVETLYYDPETGLFGGKAIGELNWGFTEADLQVPAPAALDPRE